MSARSLSPSLSRLSDAMASVNILQQAALLFAAGLGKIPRRIRPKAPKQVPPPAPLPFSFFHLSLVYASHSSLFHLFAILLPIIVVFRAPLVSQAWQHMEPLSISVFRSIKWP